MTAVMIRYKVKPEEVERNLELIRAVYEEMEAARPEGLRYATFRLEDGVSFVDLVAMEHGPQALSGLQAFGRFRSTLDERCDEPPTITDLTEVGSFRFP
ncbi:hypothetical protein GBA63_18470 [Rubrobacter tropicus]|uniref:ABM domain-containing protein n=1 Tax=Rubrobacter tropicus TaxID=2653851 RepID=A0A6G8QD90_9ACTN|nr:hypothetical protein [Rubrobacter tropicus]QIN84402.1 hypothetical protein GBA63_18470 [Rubrobacter tropicus]